MKHPVSRETSSAVTASGGQHHDVTTGLDALGLRGQAGRSDDAGAVQYRTTPLFERVFGLESLGALPRLDDLGGDAAEIRERLEQIAQSRGA